MKIVAIFLILLNIFFIFHQTKAEEISFISQPQDSLLHQTYCWQPGNQYRPIISLDGEWEYRVTDNDSFKKVILPASCDYCGEITFKKTFIPDSSFTNHFFRLICYGINYHAMIFINNKFIGTHSGGYTSFAINITEGKILINQKNIIEIKVNTRLESKYTLPQQFQPEGIKNIAGIIRSIYLLALPELCLEDVTVNYQLTKDLSECELEVNFNLIDRIHHTIEQESKKVLLPPIQYYIELIEKNKPLIKQNEGINTESYLLTRPITKKLRFKHPQLWSPETPTLYLLRIQLLQGKQVIDQIDQSIGIKQIDFQNGNIYLNGQRFILKGVNWNENYLVHGVLFERKQLARELELIKQLNANAIRVLNHPAHPMFATLCDSLGLLLLQEMPLNMVPTAWLTSDIFLDRCTDHLLETIDRDQNHVSIFAWGIGGEFLLADPVHRNFIHKMTKTAKTINNHPFYTWNSPSLVKGEIDSNIIAGVTTLGLEKDQIQNALSKWIRQNQKQINLVLSYGSPQLSRSSDKEIKAIFEEYQALQIVEAWQTIVSFPEIDGYFITALSDYQGNYPSTIFGNYEESKLRPFGLTDDVRKKRIAFETIRSLYQDGKYLLNPAIAMKKEFPVAFPLVGLGTVLVFLFMMNSRKYFRENLKRIFVHPHGFYVDLRDGRKIPPSHTIFLSIFISVGCGLVLASILSFFKYQPQIDHLMSLFLPTDNLKNYICKLSWQPGWAILFFSMINLFVFFFIAVYFKIIALLTKKRCTIIQCLTITFWLGGNFIILIPIGMVLFRVLQYEKLIVPTFLLLILSYIWFLFRTIKGMRVLFIWTFGRTFIVLIITIFITVTGVLYYYQSQDALIDYLKYYYQIYADQIFLN